jgi:hypothetical protein
MEYLEHLRKMIRQRMNDMADAIAVGSATDYAQYREMVGEIAGLAKAERDLIDMKDRLEKLAAE